MPPQRKQKKRRRQTSSLQIIPPEDVIDECRRQEILLVHKKSLSLWRHQNSESSPSLPISHVKKALKQLQITGIKTDDIQSFFEDETLEALDDDMFLRFCSHKSIQLEKSSRAFQLIDDAEKGVVVLEDLQRVCLELGENLTESELTEMIEFADNSTSKDGLLSPDHFFRIARKVNL